MYFYKIHTQDQSKSRCRSRTFWVLYSYCRHSYFNSIGSKIQNIQHGRGIASRINRSSSSYAREQSRIRNKTSCFRYFYSK